MYCWASFRIEWYLKTMKRYDILSNLIICVQKIIMHLDTRCKRVRALFGISNSNLSTFIIISFGISIRFIGKMCCFSQFVVWLFQFNLLWLCGLFALYISGYAFDSWFPDFQWIYVKPRKWNTLSSCIRTNSIGIEFMN